MQPVDSWSQWYRSVFERAFFWFLVWLAGAMLAGPLLSETASTLVWSSWSPLVAALFALHIRLIWPYRPRKK